MPPFSLSKTYYMSKGKSLFRNAFRCFLINLNDKLIILQNYPYF